MPCIALNSCKLGIRLADLALHSTTSHTSSHKEHTIERVCDTVSNEVVRNGTRENTGLVIRGISLSITCTRNSAAVESIIIKLIRAENNVVLEDFRICKYNRQVGRGKGVYPLLVKYKNIQMCVAARFDTHKYLP